jgi:dodecin
MPEHVYRITEIVGSSADSVDDAIRIGARRRRRRCITFDWFEVTEIRGHFTDETIGHFQVTMRVGFRLDDDVE